MYIQVNARVYVLANNARLFRGFSSLREGVQYKLVILGLLSGYKNKLVSMEYISRFILLDDVYIDSFKLKDHKGYCDSNINLIIKRKKYLSESYFSFSMEN